MVRTAGVQRAVASQRIPRPPRTAVCVFGLCRRRAGLSAGCVAAGPVTGVVRNGGGAVRQGPWARARTAGGP